MSLILEIEHLVGVSFAAISPDNPAPDWPPQPDRVFSALVAAWAARGERTDERRALEWLESLPAPAEVAASSGAARTSATSFVPPNDPVTGRVGNRTVLPALRRRQPRRFPAYRPDDPIVRLVWPDAEANTETIAALNALAADTPYVGHSASLTRCQFRPGEASISTAPAKRRLYTGRLDELTRLYQSGQRPTPGESIRDRASRSAQKPHSIFAERWLVMEHVGGLMPSLGAAPLVGKAIRDALMAGYKRIGKGDAIPAVLSGHASDNSPSATPHLAIVPMAFFGAQHADGHVLGFALVPPADGAMLDDEDFQGAVRAITKWRMRFARRDLVIRRREPKINFLLSVSGPSDRASLRRQPYIAAARTWATCAPIVLDQHLRAKGNEEREQEKVELIKQACANIGLPRPSRVVPSKHSAVTGAVSAYPSGHAPRWTGWKLPPSLGSRQLTHAVMQFEEPVRGPVILGAGRFVGLGLCRALDPERA